MTHVVDEGQHSELGPSAAKRWMNCPASVAATRDAPDEQSEYAASGTASHTLSEWCRNRNVSCHTFIGLKMKVGKYEFIVDKERAESVDAFCEYVYDIGGETWVEERVDYRSLVKNGFGTSDHVAVVGSTLDVVDFKDGEGVVVDAEWNPQLLLYAVGWLCMYGWMYPEIERIWLHIAQPRVNHFDRWELHVQTLRDWVDRELIPAAKETENPNAKFNPGPWCSENFCRIRRTCRARAQKLMEETIDDFKDLEDLDTPPKPLPTLTNAEVAKILAYLPQIEKWAAEIKTYAITEVMHGRAVGDFKLVAGRSSRSFTENEETVVKAIVEKELVLDEDELYTEPELKSVAQVEKIVGAAAFKPATEKKEAGPLAHLVRTNEGKPTLVPGSDRRKPITVDPSKEFAELDADE